MTDSPSGSAYAGLLRRQFFGKSVLLDSNLLLLLIVGTFQPTLVRNFKRLNSFEPLDLRLLENFTTGFHIATSAHVLTEVSNLANSLPQSLKARLFTCFASRIPMMTEVPLPAESLLNQPEFLLFGLTDAVLATLARTHLLITNDGRLASHLRVARNLPVVTLSDIRASTRLAADTKIPGH